MEERIILLLFVNKNNSDTEVKIAKLKLVLDKKIAGQYELTILDIFDNWQQAKAANIIVTPTLFKVSPLPIAKVTGDMSDSELLLKLLGIT